MRNRKVEEMLNKAVSNSVPDVLDNVLKKCEKKKGFSDMENAEIVKNEEKKKVFWTPKLVGGICVFVLLFGVLGFVGVNQYNNVFKAESIIEFDVNPSIELRINKKEEVISAEALNEDAKKVLKDMDLENVDLDVAVNAIIGSMMTNGYLTIDQNSILVSVYNDNKNESEKLQQEITNKIDKILKASSIEGAVLTQEFNEKDTEIEKLSDDYNISVGKAKLINNVLEAKVTNSKGELYTFEMLAGLSITELNLLLSSKETKVENIKSTGNVSESSYIGRNKAKEIAFKEAKTTESKVRDLEVEFDADDGRLVYEVDFKVSGVEYEYDIDARSGEVIYRHTEKDDDYVSNSTSNNSSTSNNNSSTNTSTSYISRDKAKEIVFDDAGVKESSVRNLEVELDKDDGVPTYEIEFKVGMTEYKYEIHAETGKILDKEKELDD